jgi:hypothetical protein
MEKCSTKVQINCLDTVKWTVSLSDVLYTDVTDHPN